LKVPKQPDLYDRVNTNLLYYQANYLAITVLTLIITCFFRPIFLIGLSVIIGSGVWLFRVNRSPIVVQGKVLSKQELAIGYLVASFIVCILFAGTASILALSISILMILLHSSFRKRSMKSKVNVGFMNLISGSGKSEEEPDDDGPSNGTVDEENPSPDLSSRYGGGFSSEQMLAEQQRARSQFRASMRAKYLKKG